MSPLTPIREILTSQTLTLDEKMAAMRGHFQQLVEKPDVGLRNEDMKFRADQRRTIASQARVMGREVNDAYLMENQ